MCNNVGLTLNLCTYLQEADALAQLLPIIGASPARLF